MATRDEYRSQTVEQRLQRLGRTPDDLVRAIQGQTGDMPPHPERWGIGGRIGMPLDPARLAEDRQYRRHDTVLALSSRRARREESLIFLRRLTAAQWRRGSIHLLDGRMTFDDWVALIAEHDDEHLDQLTRALAGRC